MESLSLEEENIIKDIINLLRLKKELNATAIKGIRKLFRLEEETKAINDRTIRDIENFLEHEEEDKSATGNDLRSNNYIEYRTKGDRRTLTVEKNCHL